MVIGAGLSGLVVAYELEQRGYEVTVLEASDRVGGRNLTARRGSVIDELGSPQRCAFDDKPHLYFNCGPARIPGTHQRVLQYCRAFRIPLETFINDNPNAYVQSEGFNNGEPMRRRQYLADTKGFLAELAFKGLGQSRLEEPLSEEDHHRLKAFVQQYGDLDANMRYRGTDRAGFIRGGVVQPGVRNHPSAGIRELINTPYGYFPMHFSETESQFPAMMQPVGGMDRIIDAFVARLKRPVRTGTVVRGIQVAADGVQIQMVNKQGSAQLQADICFSCMPGHLVNGLEHNFPETYRKLLGAMRGVKLSKVGLQMGQRFWENDNIYGGISWSDRDLLQIWYPSQGTHGEKGILLGGYVFDHHANERVANMSVTKRIEHALDMGEAIHPGRYRRHFEVGLSVAWHRYNHLLGCGSGFPEDPKEGSFGVEAAEEKFQLRRPILGRYYMIGDQVSFLHGWQEGAIGTAHEALSHFQNHQVKSCA